MSDGPAESEDSSQSDGLPDGFAPVTEHKKRMQAATTRVAELDGKISKVGIARLVFFLASIIVGSAGVSQNRWPLVLGGLGVFAVFLLLVAHHAKTHSLRERFRAAVELHQRHLWRIGCQLDKLKPAGAVTPGHPYAHDIDLVGEASLCQRIDVSHTVIGEKTLSRWLGKAAPREVALSRQKAVLELSVNLDFRETLEKFGAQVDGNERLDPGSFLEFTKRKDAVRGSALIGLIFTLPPATLGLFILSKMEILPYWAWMVAAGIQMVLALGQAKNTIEAFELVAARRGYVEALQGMLVVIENETFEAPLLVEIQKRVNAGGKKPSEYMARLDRWAGLAEFYTQFPVHFVVNILVLWDLHVLFQLERWNAEVGQGLEDAFDALGELEALSSLAALHYGDPDATFPDLREESAAFEAEGLAHPLLSVTARVPNDVSLPRDNAALIITGSNMAGKSTLLRSVGLNLALAYAGGPVIAESLICSPYRLRASMRVDDSLQQGASYFHAELAKLHSVVGGAENEPPLFFLLDELLRGTNARARHIGARAVLKHLLDRGASGMTATHDIALAKLEEEQPEQIRNVHFTDIMKDGEMLFDYRLRDGVVKTSNALRLLQMVGVEVDVDDSL